MIKAGLMLLGGLVGGLLLLALCVPAARGEIHLPLMLAPAGPGNWLGADELGRDVLLRAAAGLRLSVLVSFSVGLVTALVGVPLGLLAGWLAGKGLQGQLVDGLLVRLADVVLSFPGLLLALALAALLGPSTVNVVVALGLLGWVGFFRLTRIQVLALRNMPYVQAVQVAGVSLPQILGRHLLPNLAAPLVVEMVSMVAAALVAEAGLSFLGVGVPPPVASLGGMIREGTRYLLLAPHLVVVPALLLFALVVGVNLLAEGLRRRWADGMTGATKPDGIGSGLSERP